MRERDGAPELLRGDQHRVLREQQERLEYVAKGLGNFEKAHIPPVHIEIVRAIAATYLRDHADLIDPNPLACDTYNPTAEQLEHPQETRRRIQPDDGDEGESDE